MAKTWDFNAIAGKWASSMGSAQTQAAYKAGIMALTESPTAAAAKPEAEQRYIQGVQDSITSGKRQRALLAVSLQQYQTMATTKGAAHLGTGATASREKYAAKMQRFGAVYGQIQSKLAGMPKGGLANAVARSQAVIEALMQAGQSG